MRNIVQLLAGLLLFMAASALQAQAGPGFGNVPAPGAGTRAPIDPSWPQRFDLQGRAAAQYGFSVTRPGTVTIVVQWQGDPLTIVLTRPDGQKTYVNAQGSPRRFPFNATVSDLRAGTLWRLEIYPELTKVGRPGSDPNAQHHAQGSVSVQAPTLAGAPFAGQVPPPPAPGRRNTLPPPPPPSSSQAGSLAQENYQTCFAFSNGSGGQVSVQCFWRRDWCEEHVRNQTSDGGTRYPNMVVALGCTRAPVYCYSYNNGNSGACFADGNECVNNRNNFAGQQRGASVGSCKDYTGGMVRN